jgi:hypothetical protein
MREYERRYVNWVTNNPSATAAQKDEYARSLGKAMQDTLNELKTMQFTLPSRFFENLRGLDDSSLAKAARLLMQNQKPTTPQKPK